MRIAHSVFADATAFELIDQCTSSQTMVDNAGTPAQHVDRERHAQEH
jgi:hypothetical protein